MSITTLYGHINGLLINRNGQRNFLFSVTLARVLKNTDNYRDRQMDGMTSKMWWQEHLQTGWRRIPRIHLKDVDLYTKPV